MAKPTKPKGKGGRRRELTKGTGVRLRSRFGPPSTFDRLPDEAREDLAWAFEQARAGRTPKVKILAELNTRLAARGIAPVSARTFSRRTVWLERYGEDLARTREIAAALTAKLDAAPAADVGLMINELTKSILFDTIANAQLTDGVSLAMIGDIATVLGKLEGARKLSLDLRREIEKELAAKARTAAERGGAARGLSAEQVAMIKSQILGIDMTNPPPGQAAWPPKSKE